MSVVAAGSVDDFTPAVQTEMRAAVAAEAGVAVSDVSLAVEAASVRLTFTITLPSEAAATAAVGALQARLLNPAAASAFLSTASLTVAVESIVSAPAIVQPDAGSGEAGSGEASSGGEVTGDRGSGSGEVASGGAASEMSSGSGGEALETGSGSGD